MAEQQVKERDDTQTEELAQEAQRPKNVPAIASARLPYHPSFQERFGVDQSGWRVLVESTFPSAKTIEGVLLAMAYCKARKLDIFKKPVHVVPIWSTAKNGYVESVWPGVNELRSTAFRTGSYAGCDATAFGADTTFEFEGKVKESGNYVTKKIKIVVPLYAQITVYRIVNGVRCAFPGPRVFFKETYNTIGKTDLPNDKWERSPSYMLEKCAEAAALRKAFPEEIGDQQSAEEMEGGRFEMAGGETIDHEPQPQPARPTRAATDALRKEQVQQNQQYRQTMSVPPADVVAEDDGAERADAQEEQKPQTQQEQAKPAQTKAAPKQEAETNEHVLVENVLRKKLAELKSLKLFKPAFIDYMPELEKMREEDPDRRKSLLGDIFAKHPELQELTE